MPTIEVSDETYDKIKDQLGSDYEVLEVNELKDLIGQTVTVWCARYIYHGEVSAVNSQFLTLKKAGIVYETGELGARKPEDLQELPGDCQVLLQSIESIIKLRW